MAPNQGAHNRQKQPKDTIFKPLSELMLLNLKPLLPTLFPANILLEQTTDWKLKRKKSNK